jgi:hypothetical protein
MASFDPKSRYAKHASTYEVEDRRGRKVVALTPAEPPPEARLGEHLRKQGQRLDHLANHYLRDPNGFWRLAEMNDKVLPDAVLVEDSILIPAKTR